MKLFDVFYTSCYFKIKTKTNKVFKKQEKLTHFNKIGKYILNMHIFSILKFSL